MAEREVGSSASEDSWDGVVGGFGVIAAVLALLTWAISEAFGLPPAVHHAPLILLAACVVLLGIVGGYHFWRARQSIVDAWRGRPGLSPTVSHGVLSAVDSLRPDDWERQRDTAAAFMLVPGTGSILHGGFGWHLPTWLWWTCTLFAALALLYALAAAVSYLRERYLRNAKSDRNVRV